MTLITDIQAIDGHAGMTAAEIVTALQQITDTVNDSTAWTIGAIANQSPELAGKLELSLASMAAAGVPFAGSTLTAASTVGLRIDSEQRQQLIDQLAVASQEMIEQLRWDASFVSAIKALGIRQVQRYPDVTVEQVTEAIESETLRIRSGWINDAIQSDAVQAVLRDETKTMAETQTAVSDAIEAAWGGE